MDPQGKSTIWRWTQRGSRYHEIGMRVCGIEVELTRTPTGFEVAHAGTRLGSVRKVERMGEIMWQAEDSKRFRTMMTQAVEELLVRAELIDGLGW
jgi:hypothetical protein